jgi:hypothetical protein
LLDLLERARLQSAVVTAKTLTPNFANSNRANGTLLKVRFIARRSRRILSTEPEVLVNASPAPGVTLELSFDTTTSPAPVRPYELALYLLAPCTETAAATNPVERFKVEKVEAKPEDPSLGPLWTGALQFVLRNSAALGNLCRGLWVGLRGALDRPRTNFELQVKVGGDSVRLKAEQLRACSREPGKEFEALQTLLTELVRELRSLPPG